MIKTGLGLCAESRTQGHPAASLLPTGHMHQREAGLLGLWDRPLKMELGAAPFPDGHEAQKAPAMCLEQWAQQGTDRSCPQSRVNGKGLSMPPP